MRASTNNSVAIHYTHRLAVGRVSPALLLPKSNGRRSIAYLAEPYRSIDHQNEHNLSSLCKFRRCISIDNPPEDAKLQLDEVSLLVDSTSTPREKMLYLASSLGNGAQARSFVGYDGRSSSGMNDSSSRRSRMGWTWKNRLAGINSIIMNSTSNNNLPPVIQTHSEDGLQWTERELKCIGISKRPLFPGFFQMVAITDPTVFEIIYNEFTSRQSVQSKDVKNSSKNPFLVAGFLVKSTTSDDEVNNRTGESPSVLYQYGCIAEIINVIPDEECSIFKNAGNTSTRSAGKLITFPHALAKLKDGSVTIDTVSNPFPSLHVYVNASDAKAMKSDYKTQNERQQALHLEVIATLKELTVISKPYRDSFGQLLRFDSIDDSFLLSNLAAACSQSTGEELQQILTVTDVEKRLEAALALLKKDAQVAKLQAEIRERFESKIERDQRRYFLKEQLAFVKEELANDSSLEDDEEDDLDSANNDPKGTSESKRKRKSKKTTDTPSTSTEQHLNSPEARQRKLVTSLPPEYQKKLKGKTIPKEAQEAIKVQAKRLKLLDANSAEYSIVSSHLAWLCDVPWGVYSLGEVDLHKAESILNRNHYGLKDIKETLLEFVAIQKLGTQQKSSKQEHEGSPHNGQQEDDPTGVKGKILCLVGSTGVGKTSLAESVAESLGRKFCRISLSGLSDVAELRGHRRTYVGALPGRIIAALKDANTMNPLLLLDEIDKVGQEHRGNPLHVLLEALDPSQNNHFRDHYLDVPVDLGKILFVCTANSIQTLPAALRSRMEVVTVPGYTTEEKVKIASDYLLPEVLKEIPVEKSTFEIVPTCWKTIIELYTTESGVRQLRRSIEKILRKVALSQMRQSKSEKTVVSSETLSKYLGVPKLSMEQRYVTLMHPGISLGLAWTESGGSLLPVESVGLNRKVGGKSPETPSVGDTSTNPPPTVTQPASSPHDPLATLKVTGRVGKILRESCDLAVSVTRQELRKRDGNNKFFDSHSLHIHLPEGAVPKDGPSAGISIASSLYSLATNQTIRPHLSMTGELTLSGRVLKVGGIREKVMAAQQAGMKELILPETNRRDFEGLDKSLRDSFKVSYVTSFSDVVSLLF